MPGDRSLLIVEDDKSFLQRLARAMEGRGFTVTTAESVADGLTQLETTSPASYAPSAVPKPPPRGATGGDSRRGKPQAFRPTQPTAISTDLTRLLRRSKRHVG
jgi:CheY-like chemotaxis protein